MEWWREAAPQQYSTAPIRECYHLVVLAELDGHYQVSNVERGIMDYCWILTINGITSTGSTHQDESLLRGTLGMLFIIHRTKLLQLFPHIYGQQVYSCCGSFEWLSGSFSSKNTHVSLLDVEKKRWSSFALCIMNSISKVPHIKSLVKESRNLSKKQPKC